MASTFTVRSAEGYDRIMGRWSRRLAKPFIDFARLPAEASVAEIGCGTGSLTFVLAERGAARRVAAIDHSPIFVEAARRRNARPWITIEEGDAGSLPWPDGSFDAALSMLVLQFVPEAPRAVAEMIRVTRRGGVVAAAVWDSRGGMPNMRMVWDTMAALDPATRPRRDEALSRPLTGPGEMRACWAGLGLVDVEQADVTIRMDYESFDDFWAPIAAGEGPLGKHVTGLGADEAARVEEAVRSAYGAPADGARSFAATAWVCRGVVPG